MNISTDVIFREVIFIATSSKKCVIKISTDVIFCEVTFCDSFSDKG